MPLLQETALDELELKCSVLELSDNWIESEFESLRQILFCSDIVRVNEVGKRVHDDDEEVVPVEGW